MPDPNVPAFELEELVGVLERTGGYRVARRFRRRRRYAEPDGTAVIPGLYVDVETTGLAAGDSIIQLAAIAFEFAKDGRIFSVDDPHTYLEDPGRAIPPTITALTGITDADVAGRRIDDGAVSQLAADSRLVVAHNAAFDRPMVERRLPCFRALPWACSYAEVPWADHGIRSAKLEYLLWRHCSEFFAGHVADEDAAAGIHLLATPFATGELPMSALLASSRRRTARIWATDAPYAAKDILRLRGYRWNPGEDGRPRAWYLDTFDDEAGAECAWLQAHVYARTRARWRKQVFNAYDRYSDRV